MLWDGRKERDAKQGREGKGVRMHQDGEKTKDTEALMYTNGREGYRV